MKETITRRQILESLQIALTVTVVGAVLAGGCGAGGPGLDPDHAEETLLLPAADQRAYGSYLAYEHVIRAGVLRERGQLEEAAVELRAALETDPDDFALRTWLAEVLMEQGELARAEKQLRRAIAREPTAELSWVALAELHRRRGDIEAADQAARRGMRVEPRRHEAALWLAGQHRERGELERAAEVYRQIIGARPDHALALRGLGEINLEQGHPGLAREHLGRYLTLDRSESSVVVALAEAHLQSDDPSTAIDLLELALARETADDALRGRLVQLLLDEGRHRSAAHHLASLSSLAPGDVAGAVRQACWWLEAGNPYRARELLLEVAGGIPDEPAGRLSLARIETRLGRLEQARQLLRTAPTGGWRELDQPQIEEIEERINAWPADARGCRDGTP